ncbi:722_t:CDS:2 [Acaulospora morrowiae]|uniref:722_t:CDS:1 n=1 Tax=Acaulospora morrowiae TaxID=94023 RepID=A0A9N9GJK9_9GLOM|nr:722_t:CDS:2 [Acaulospora morrowiae]
MSTETASTNFIQTTVETASGGAKQVDASVQEIVEDLVKSDDSEKASTDSLSHQAPLLSVLSDRTTFVPEISLEAAEVFFLKTPKKVFFILYILILLVWNYLSMVSLLLLGLGCLIGYALRHVVANQPKEKFVAVQESYIRQNSQNSRQQIKSTEKFTLLELKITPRIDDSLNKIHSYIIRDIVDFYYDPINPNKDLELSTQVRNAMNAIAMNLATCLQNSDKVELGLMSGFAIANTFIVHLREYRKFNATSKPLDVYCKENKSSLFAYTTNRELQAQTLRSLSQLLFERFLPPTESQSRILMAFLSELLATQIFETALETVCDHDWINLTIVDYLTENDPGETHDTTLFQQLATSIDEEVAGLAEKLQNVDNQAGMSIDELENGSSFKANLLIESNSNLNYDESNSVGIYSNARLPNFISSPFPPNHPFTRSANSINLQKILDRQSEMFAEFMAFLEERNAANILRFWLQADSFRKIASNESDVNLIQADALGIFKAYFGEAATYPVKVVDESIVKQCIREILKAPTCNCFIIMQEYIFGVLQDLYFDDFVKAMKEQGEDMSFMVKEQEARHKEVEQYPEANSTSLSNMEQHEEVKTNSSLNMHQNDEFHRRYYTVDNSVLESNHHEAEAYDNAIKEVTSPRRWSAAIMVESMEEPNDNSALENSVDLSPEEENMDQEIDIDPQFERQKEPMMNLDGVRIKMTDVSEASPNKYIYSTKSLAYMIEVVQPGSTGWIMTRRFADFEKMHASLVKAFPKAEKVTMPRLMLKKNQEACKSLERYLNILLSDASLCESEPLQKFMKRDGLPIEKLEKTKSTRRALSILSVSKSVSMSNLVGVVAASASSSYNEAKNQQESLPATNHNSEESSPEKSLETSSKRSSNSSLQKNLEVSLSPTEISQLASDETYVKTSAPTDASVITRPSIESPISTSWESSRTITPTVSNDSGTSPIVMTDKSTLEKLRMQFEISHATESQPERRLRQDKQLTVQDKDLLIDTIFAVVEEIFDLSEKSAWHLRKTVLSVLRGVVRRSYTEAIKNSFLMTINSFSTENYWVTMIDNLSNSFWPNGEWSSVAQQRTEEEKLKTKEEAKRLLLQKAVPDSLKQVMGYENSRLMVGRLVDGFLAEKEVVRGMGINILEGVVKLIVAD